MTALACALAYVATLAFAGFVIWFRARHRETVRDMAVKAAQVAEAVRHEVKAARAGWDDAARFVEAERLGKSGAFGPRKSTG